MGTAKRVDTFLLPLLLLSIFVNFITKKAYYTSPDGISITFHRCDLYNGLDSFVLSTFHRIKLKYVIYNNKEIGMLVIITTVCVATSNHSRARLTIVNLRLSYRKKESNCHQNIRGLYGKIDEVQEILLSYNFDIFSLSVYLFSISEGTVSSNVIEKVVKVEVYAS